MKREKMYFDFDSIAYNFIINNNILRQKQKRIFEDLVEGKTIKELSIKYKCSERTICYWKKEIFKKIGCLCNYAPSMGDIQVYYSENKPIIKECGENEFKVVDTDTLLYKIYLLTFPNNKVYVGMTSQKEKSRWSNGNGYINNEIMYNDILKYGWINIKKDILFKDLLYDEAREKEKQLIIHYKSHLKKYGYNKDF